MITGERTQSIEGSAEGDGITRIIIYLFHDSRGEVDDYVLYKLRALRPFAQHIFVVVNGALTPAARARLTAVVDTVWERENSGFDVGGYRAALGHLGEKYLAGFDELILMNYTWFGPVRPFEPLFTRMDQRDVDFWGLTDHDGVVPNPYTLSGEMPRHIQSHWIAVRRRMFLSDAWRRYWADMPLINTYTESILNHESRFTQHFTDHGYRSEVAFSVDDYPTAHPAMLNPVELLEDGCPALKRRVFFHYPPFMERHAVIGRWTAQRAAEFGYPVAMMWQNLSRTVAPKTLNADAQMLEVLPDQDVSYDPQRPFRIAAVIHIFYEEMADELFDRVAMLPSEVDVFVTTTDDDKAAAIRETIAQRGDTRLRYEVRVLPSNRGRDVSAFFIGCRDVLRGEAYDLIVKLHSKKTLQQSFNAGRIFARQQVENVISSPGYVANVLALFQREPGLGLVYPPMIHIGYPTMGRAWFGNYGPVEKLAKKLGIRVPLDQVSPLAAFGCMWVCRPEALRLLADVDWEYTQYAAPDEHKDGGLAHVQERIVSYAAAELGYHTRTILNFEHASISHTALEYKLDLMSSTTPGYSLEQIQLLHRVGHIGRGGARNFVRAQLRLNMPRTTRALYPVVVLARRMRNFLRSRSTQLSPGMGLPGGADAVVSDLPGPGDAEVSDLS